MRRRMLELTSSMTVAVVVTAAITAAHGGIGTAARCIGDRDVRCDGIAGSWAVLVPSKLTEGTGLDSSLRRLLLVACGLLVGGGAYWLDQTLMADLWNQSWQVNSRPHDAAFEFVGSHPLLANGQPTLAAYLLFFGGLFALRPWWRHIDSFRTKQFRVSTTLLTTAVGLVLPYVWAFPVAWGTLWAVAISSVVQLSSTWVPTHQRATDGGRNRCTRYHIAEPRFRACFFCSPCLWWLCCRCCADLSSWWAATARWV